MIIILEDATLLALAQILAILALEAIYLPLLFAPRFVETESLRQLKPAMTKTLLMEMAALLFVRLKKIMNVMDQVTQHVDQYVEMVKSYLLKPVMTDHQTQSDAIQLVMVLLMDTIAQEDL